MASSMPVGVPGVAAVTASPGERIRVGVDDGFYQLHGRRVGDERRGMRKNLAVFVHGKVRSDRTSVHLDSIGSDDLDNMSAMRELADGRRLVPGERDNVCRELRLDPVGVRVRCVGR